MSRGPGVPQPLAGRGPRLRERINGVLLLDKPRGFSSSQAVGVARRLMGADKAGHGGTLDPMASGLLPVLFGEATKFAHDLLEADKTYVATLRLGQTSTTADAEGEITDTGTAIPDEATLRAAAARFVGPIAQRPPMHSALKHQGRPLYDYARSGIEIERALRQIVIHRLDVLWFEGERVGLRVHCSKGTYIRTLAEDIGSAAGCGAWLADLRREAVDALSIADSVTQAALEALDLQARRALLLPPDALLQSLPRVDLSPADAQRFGNGQRLRLAPRTDQRPERVRVYHGQHLIGVAMLDQGLLVPQRLIAAPVASTETESSPSLPNLTASNTVASDSRNQDPLQ